jgi:hypothetical protein
MHILGITRRSFDMFGLFSSPAIVREPNGTDPSAAGGRGSAVEEA